MIITDLETKLNKDLLFNLITNAFAKRNKFLNLNETNIYRLINSSGDYLPGLFVDIYNDVAVIQIERSKILEFKDEIVNILLKILNLNSIIEKSNTWLAKKNNIENVKLLYGATRNLIHCKESNINLIVDPFMSKTGFFIDLRDVRKFISDKSVNNTILNCFSFTCSIGVFALINKAKKVINLDKRKDVLDLGKLNYKVNKLEVNNTDFVVCNVKDYLDNNKNEKYDIIILDPPEIIVEMERLNEVKEIYYSLNVLALKSLKEDGFFITTKCSHGFPSSMFISIINKIIKENKNISIISHLKAPFDHPTSKYDNTLDYLDIFIIKK